MTRGFLVGILALVLLPASSGGQTLEPAGQPVWDVARAVLFDPTTYVPAAIAHEAMMRDWKTSQILFAHGWKERNPRFTVSGLPDDVPVSYSAGKRRIRAAALEVFGYSALNNTAAAVAERVLISRYPRQRTLIRTLSWIERIGYASFIAYRNSADHVRQSRENQRLARDYGYAR